MKIVILIMLFLVSAYGQKNNLERVSLQLQWKNQFQFAGYFIAKEKGFYNEEGIDIELKSHHFGIDPVKEVLDRRADFGTGRVSLLLDRAQGKKVILLSAIFQSSPLVLAAMKSSNITNLSNLKNKKISINLTDNAPLIFAVIASESIVKKNHKHIATTDKIKSLMNNEIDIGSFYTSNQIYTMKKMGLELNIFDASDYGFDFYSDLLFTSEDVALNNPRLVYNFKKASLRGWRYAFDNIEETVDIILKKYNTQNKTKEELLYEANILKALAYKNTNELGKVDKYRIQSLFNLYKITGITKGYKLDTDNFIFDKDYSNIFVLSKKEVKYLEQKKFITMCIDPNWMPFEMFDKSGNHIGMTADYFKIIKEEFKLPIKVIKTKLWSESLSLAKKRECDILSLVMETPERKKYLNFTKSYLSVPLVVATQVDVPFINNIESIQNKSIGITKGYAFIELLKNKYKNLNIVEVENIDEGLIKVNKGELFGYIGTLATISHKFQTTSRGELKIAGKLEEKWELGIGVRNDDETLFNILNNAVNSINSKRQQEILNDWISIKYEKGIDYSLVIIITIIFVLIIALVILWNLKLKSEINKRKEAEKSFKSISKKLNGLYKLSPLGIVLTDMNGNYIEFNESFEKICGYTKEELKTLDYWELTPKEYEKDELVQIKSLENTGLYGSYEKEYIQKNGNRIPVNLNSMIIIGDDGKQYVWSIIEDISNRKKTEQTIIEQSKLAAMGEMIGNISHQWRQPLSIISTASTGMQIQKEMDLLDDESFYKSCNAINNNAQYLSKTIDDFKNFIKGDRFKRIFTLEDTIHSFLNLVNGSVVSSNIPIILDLHKDIKIDGYENELIQCFINIFNNSKDALKEKEIENKFIFISTSIENDKSSIKIKDNAGGIPENVLLRIFEPYFTTKHKSQGTGLGLHMTYNLIVDGMDGTIEANNVNYEYQDKEYTGAEFTITLPLS